MVNDFFDLPDATAVGTSIYIDAVGDRKECSKGHGH